jgi:AcrR family transcriptional regulator
MSETSTGASRRETILQAALQCFSQHGVEAATIEMIRAASGASTGSLYHHFGNKERIAAEVYLAGLRDFRQVQQAYVERATTLEEGIRAIVHAHVDWIDANPDWARYLFNHRGVLEKAGADRGHAAELQESQAQLAEWFQARMPAGQRLRWPQEAYVSLLVGPVHDYARHWLAGRRPEGLRELRDFFAEAACRAVGMSLAGRV